VNEAWKNVHNLSWGIENPAKNWRNIGATVDMPLLSGEFQKDFHSMF
jgi:hypothetical protein